MFLQGWGRRTGSLYSKQPNSLMVFREEFLKATFWGEACRVCDFLLIGWWWSHRVLSLEFQPLVLTSLASKYCHHPSHGGVCVGGQPVSAEWFKDMRQIAIYTFQEELGVLWIYHSIAPWNQGRPRIWKVLYCFFCFFLVVVFLFPSNRKQKNMKGLLYSGGSAWSWLTSFSFLLKA